RCGRRPQSELEVVEGCNLDRFDDDRRVMRPDHRAQMAAAIARFLAEIRRLVQAVPRQERERLLSVLDPARAQPAAGAATPRQPTTREGRAGAGTRARPEGTRRTRKPRGAASTRAEPTVAASVSATPPSLEAARRTDSTTTS